MSKYNKALTVYLLFLCLAAVTANSAAAQAAAVKLFQGPNGAGMAQDIPPGTYQVSGTQMAESLGKDAVISVQVAKGFRIRFCETAGSNGEGGGKCEELGEGIKNLQSLNFNLIKVWKESAPVVVFEQANWAGRAQPFFPGKYRHDRVEFGRINDNMAMSVAVAKGYKARFCENVGLYARGGGSCEEHEEGKHNIRLANAISFIEVIDLSDKSPDDDTLPVVLYEDTTQGGKKQGFDVGTFLASAGGLGKILNDTASSIVIKPGYRVRVCAD